MAIYRGYRYQEAGHLLVTKDGEVLSPERSQKLWNHSPDGFQWGYGGSGPAQLALAKWGDQWEITTEEIKDWIQKRVLT